MVLTTLKFCPFNRKKGKKLWWKVGKKVWEAGQAYGGRICSLLKIELNLLLKVSWAENSYRLDEYHVNDMYAPKMLLKSWWILMSCSPRNNFLFAVATSSVLPMLQVCPKYMHEFKSVPFFKLSVCQYY